MKGPAIFRETDTGFVKADMTLVAKTMGGGAVDLAGWTMVESQRGSYEVNIPLMITDGTIFIYKTSTPSIKYDGFFTADVIGTLQPDISDAGDKAEAARVAAVAAQAAAENIDLSGVAQAGEAAAALTSYGAAKPADLTDLAKTSDVVDTAGALATLIGGVPAAVRDVSNANPAPGSMGEGVANLATPVVTVTPDYPSTITYRAAAPAVGKIDRVVMHSGMILIYQYDINDKLTGVVEE